MFGWLRGKPLPEDDELQSLTSRWLGPKALAVALAESVQEHTNRIKTGEVKYPAHRRKGVSVVQIWHDLRLEALHKLFNFGQSDIWLLCDQRLQTRIMARFLEDRPYLGALQPRGEEIADTNQAVCEVYLYLGKVGSEVADRETDDALLKITRRSIFDNFALEVNKSVHLWQEYERAITSHESLPNLPATLIEILYRDVTLKSKSIALSTVFGPSYEDGIKHAESAVQEHGGDVVPMREALQRLMAARDPDEYAIVEKKQNNM